MPALLITGGSGLLGRHVLQKIPAAFEPICVGRTRPRVAREVEYIGADLCQPDFVNWLPSKIDAVLHLAQGDEYSDFPTGAMNVFQVNVAAVATLLAWARTAGATHFIHASTGGLYGLGPQPFREIDAINIAGRLAYYYSTKYAAETIANAYRDYMRVISLRYFFIYGDNQRSSMLIPRLIDTVQRGRPIILSGNSGMRLNPIYAEDAAAAAISALATDTSNTINVAGPDVVSMRELGSTIAGELEKPVLFEQTEAAKGRDLIADISLMSMCLGAPRVGIKEGIRNVCHATSRAQQ